MKQKEYQKEYRKKHKEDRKKYMEKYIKKNKMKIKEYKKKYYRLNKKKYIKQSKEEKNKKARDYYQKNKEKCIAKSIKWQQKVKDDPYRKFKNRIKANIRYHIKKNGIKIFDLLGYTKEEFLNRMRETLPKEYTWEDFLSNSRLFHIDHIIPQNIYKNEIEYIEKCWNLRNLRLISAKENLNRLAVIDMNLVEEYKIKDLLPIS